MNEWMNNLLGVYSGKQNDERVHFVIRSIMPYLDLTDCPTDRPSKHDISLLYGQSTAKYTHHRSY